MISLIRWPLQGTTARAVSWARAGIAATSVAPISAAWANPEGRRLVIVLPPHPALELFQAPLGVRFLGGSRPRAPEAVDLVSQLAVAIAVELPHRLLLGARGADGPLRRNPC